jgi:hypothetical protein
MTAMKAHERTPRQRRPGCERLHCPLLAIGGVAGEGKTQKMTDIAFYCFWRKDTSLTLITEFHFGNYAAEQRRTSNFYESITCDDVVKVTKNVFTLPQVMGLYHLIVPEADYNYLSSTIVSKFRQVEFTQVFCTPWSLDGPDLYHHYLHLQEERCTLEGIPEDKWEFAFGHEPEHAYEYYLRRDRCDDVPAGIFMEIHVPHATRLSYRLPLEKNASLPPDLLVVESSPFRHPNDARPGVRPRKPLLMRTYASDLIKGMQRPLVISPSLLLEHGLLQATTDAYFCSHTAFARLRPLLEPNWWDWQEVTSVEIQ